MRLSFLTELTAEGLGERWNGPAEKKSRAADTGKGVPKAKYYVVEELASAEHEAGLWELHVQEAHLGLGQSCNRLGGRRRVDVTAKKCDLNRTRETS